MQHMKKEEFDVIGRNSILSWHKQTREKDNKTKLCHSPAQPSPADPTQHLFHSLHFNFIRYMRMHHYIDNDRKKEVGDVSTNVSNRFELSNIIFDCLLRIVIRHIIKTSPHSIKLRHTRKSKSLVMEWIRKWHRKRHQHPIHYHVCTCS